MFLEYIVSGLPVVALIAARTTWTPLGRNTAVSCETGENVLENSPVHKSLNLKNCHGFRFALVWIIILTPLGEQIRS